MNTTATPSGPPTGDLLAQIKAESGLSYQALADRLSAYLGRPVSKPHIVNMIQGRRRATAAVRRAVQALAAGLDSLTPEAVVIVSSVAGPHDLDGAWVPTPAQPCAHCQRRFVPGNPQSRYCGPACKRAARRARESARRLNGGGLTNTKECA